MKVSDYGRTVIGQTERGKICQAHYHKEHGASKNKQITIITKQVFQPARSGEGDRLDHPRFSPVPITRNQNKYMTAL